MLIAFLAAVQSSDYHSNCEGVKANRTSTVLYDNLFSVTVSVSRIGLTEIMLKMLRDEAVRDHDDLDGALNKEETHESQIKTNEYIPFCASDPNRTSPLTTSFPSRIIPMPLSAALFEAASMTFKAKRDLITEHLMCCIIKGSSGRFPDVSGYSSVGSFISGVVAIEEELPIEVLDPRGHNPPFGHPFRTTLQPGELALYWAAQPVAIPPNKRTYFQVEFGYWQLARASRVRVVDFETDWLGR